MSVDVSKLLQMKKACKEASEKRIKAEGLMEESLSKLKEMGYASIQAAKKEASALEKKITDMESEIEDMVDALEEEFPEL